MNHLQWIIQGQHRDAEILNPREHIWKTNKNLISKRWGQKYPVPQAGYTSVEYLLSAGVNFKQDRKQDSQN